ncbi:hypothetical protein LCGC14_0772940 [marine sediment metagenome]|uniref:Uncharacterized protein n=1 Tax=marine sediment metagenome TaxID=412755 RepID=A0A0F9T4L7_9ZZZZ
MPTPRLLHPVPVELRKKDVARTIMDDNYSEPVGQVHRKQKPVKLVAQHMIKKEKMAVATEGGVQEESDGYLLFRTSDLRDKKCDVERGDRIVSMGGSKNQRTTNFYIVKLQFIGHYPEHGGATLLKAFYQDRQPSRV